MHDDEPALPNLQIPGIPRLKTQPGRHTLDLRGDTRSAYEQLAQTFGTKVTFDPDVVSRQVRMQLDNVDFNTAVPILGTGTGTFWRPLDAGLMFVAPDSPAVRRQLVLQAERPFR